MAGTQWKDKYHGKSVTGEYYDYVNTYKVMKFEMVDTDAGTFEAFKISRKIRIAKKPKVNFATNWYSPDVKLIVKEKTSWRYGRNLLSYELARDDLVK